jgi:hypothetical protein
LPQAGRARLSLAVAVSAKFAGSHT